MQANGAYARSCLAFCMTIAAIVPARPEPAISGSIEICAPAPAITPAPTAGRSFIDATAIEASGAASVTAILESVPGVSISGNGAAGAQAAVTLRGSTANQVLVIVDRTPVSDPSTGLTDFSRLGLSPGDIASIEVLRGGASAQFGPDAVGGVVIITTKRAKHGEAVSVEIAASNLSRVPFRAVDGTGSSAVAIRPSLLSLLDGQSAAVRLSLPAGLAISAELDRSQNAYLYFDAGNTRRVRENADLLSSALSLSWSGICGGGRLEAALAGNLRSIGIPGSASSLTPEAREDDGRLRGSVSYSTDSFLSDRIALDTSLHALVAGTRYREDDAAPEDTNVASRAGLDLRSSILAASFLRLGSGASFRYERLDSSNVADSSGGAPTRLSAGAYIEPEFDLGRWKLVPAARFDCTSDFPSGFSLSFGASRSLGPGLSASLNANTSYRAPSFDDLYWPAASGVEGNPGLAPEAAYGGDLGVDFRSKGLAIAATIYARYVEDVILWQPGGDGIWRPSNYGAAFYPGLELSASRSGPGPFSASLSYTYLHSYVLSGALGLADDLRVPMVPEHAFDLSLSYRAERFSAGAKLSYTGLRYYKIANIAFDSAHLIVDVHAKIDNGDAVSLALDAENLLDERYESVQGYPMPGFSLRTVVSLRLGGDR